MDETKRVEGDVALQKPPGQPAAIVQRHKAEDGQARSGLIDGEGHGR
jgi:hypothetical protein